MAIHNDLGRWGENKAKEFLQNLGYSILELNWRQGKAEIDLIAQTNNTIVFVEVKTRSTLAFGLPADFVSEKKKEMMFDAAQVFLELNPQLDDVEARFDIISILKEGEKVMIEHYPEAFSHRP